MTATVAANSKNRIAFLYGFKTVLRPLNKETDLDFCVWAMNNRELARLLKRNRPVTRAEEEKWFNNLPERKDDIILAIEDYSNPGIIIGVIGLHQINWIDRRATTGAWIGNKEYWNKGFGSDAKMFLLYYAFDELNLRKIYSSVWSFNGRSHAYSLKCGYREEARLIDYHFCEGKYWDRIFLSITREQWYPIWLYIQTHNGQFPERRKE